MPTIHGVTVSNLELALAIACIVGVLLITISFTILLPLALKADGSEKVRLTDGYVSLVVIGQVLVYAYLGHEVYRKYM